MSFKKSLAALAVLGTAAGFAAAANVNLYGVVDEVLVYNYKDVTNFAGQKEVDGQSNLKLESGYNASSRWGLKGSEDLGNGLTVSFKLENGFSGDDGTLSQNGRLFGREASLSLSGAFGTLSFGRMGGVGSSCGTYDLVYAFADAFDGLDNSVGGLAISDRYDNMITYQTPAFAGVQATVQYSLKEDSTGDEGKASANRYASAAVTGEFGALNLVAAYEYQNFSTLGGDVEDGHTVYVGGNYDCGFAKTFLMAQYFKGLKADQIDAFSGDFIESKDGIKGYGLHIGTVFPVASGDVTLAAYYVDASAEKVEGNADRDMSYVGIDGRYTYPLSKRTSIYGGAGYAQAKYDAISETSDRKEKVAQAYLGLTHTF